MLPTSKFWACAILACASIGATVTQAAAPKYSAIYVFGDSYCDVGNIYIATKGEIPAPPYYKGHFSNGHIWVEDLAAKLGVAMKPALAGGTDYAFGGAYAAAPQVMPEGTIPDVPEQVGLYLKEHGGKADPKALYILEGGGNDILGAIAKGGGRPDKLGLDIAEAISEGELLLRRAGAKRFLVPNLFNVGFLPAAAANRKFAEEATEATNSELNNLLEVESFLEGVKIERVNTFGLIQQIEAKPAHYGFKNITTPCLNAKTGKVCSNPSQYFFWDVEHPTAFAHTYFATATLDVLDK